MPHRKFSKPSPAIQPPVLRQIASTERLILRAAVRPSIPVTITTVVADAARGVAETYLAAGDRRHQRQVLLEAYLAQVTSADRRDERAHEALRAFIALATRFVETGHVDAAVELLSRLAPTLGGGGLPALPHHLDGGS